MLVPNILLNGLPIDPNRPKWIPEYLGPRGIHRLPTPNLGHLRPSDPQRPGTPNINFDGVLGQSRYLFGVTGKTKNQIGRLDDIL